MELFIQDHFFDDSNGDTVTVWGFVWHGCLAECTFVGMSVLFCENAKQFSMVLLPTW
jgi:hypothetical protein